MKITYNINLAGRQFVIDDDAYQMLRQYLDSIFTAYSASPDRSEITGDIEARVAELFLEQMGSAGSIVTIGNVRSVIDRIGQPQDFMDVEEEISVKETPQGEEIKVEQQNIPPTPPPPLPVSKKLFRDPQNKMLGGVCAGVAAYFGIDVTWIRLLCVVLAFLSVSGVCIVYIVLWIVVPEARTPYDRLRMYGMQPTPENIGRSVNEMYHNQQSGKSTVWQIASTIANILLICVAAVGAIIAVSLVLVVFIFIVLLLTNAGDVYEHLPYYTDGHPWLYIVTFIASLVAIIIPFAVLAFNVFRKHSKPMGTASKTTIAVVWVLSVLISVACVTVIKNVCMDEDNGKSTEITVVDETESDTAVDEDTLQLEDSVKAETVNDTIRHGNVEIVKSKERKNGKESVTVTKNGKKVKIER